MNDRKEEPTRQPTLNGVVTTLEKIEEKKKDKSVRVVEKGGEGSKEFVVLEKLHG